MLHPLKRESRWISLPCLELAIEGFPEASEFRDCLLLLTDAELAFLRGCFGSVDFRMIFSAELFCFALAIVDD